MLLEHVFKILYKNGFAPNFFPHFFLIWKSDQKIMLIIYGIYFLLFYFAYSVIKICYACFFISPELRQIPSLQLIDNIKWNIGYIIREPSVHMIRVHLMRSLNKKGIIKVIIIWSIWLSLYFILSYPFILRFYYFLK